MLASPKGKSQDMLPLESFVLPGERVSTPEQDQKCGAFGGVYPNEKKEIIASVAGFVRGKKNISVVHWKAGDIIPSVGDIAIGKIIKITQRYAQAEIICINEKPLLHSCIGIIRSQDIRELESGDVRFGNVTVPQISSKERSSHW